MMATVFYFNWEPELIRWMQQFMGTIGVWIASAVTTFGEKTILVVILGYLYWCRDKRLAKILGVNLVVAMIANPMLKNLVFRTRPYFNHEGIQCLKPVDSSASVYDISAQGYSFPSGHATNAATAFGTLSIRKEKWIFFLIGVGIPLAVGVSRVALGVHYPTDVIVGWILGYVIAFLGTWIQSRVKREKLFRSCLFLIVLTGCFYCRTNEYFTALGVMLGFFLAIPFEERFVNFEVTKSIPWGALRIAGGIGVYLVVNQVLKLPFSKEFMESITWQAQLIRVMRYGVIIFCMIAVYPLCFKMRKRKGE